MVESPPQPMQDLDLHTFSDHPVHHGDASSRTRAEEAGASAPCTLLDRVLVWLTVLALLASAAASLLGGTP